MRNSDKKITRIAAVMDLRGREFFDSLIDALDILEKEEDVKPHILFLDADDETFVRSYKETRRSHPLAPSGLPLEGIKKNESYYPN